MLYLKGVSVWLIEWFQKQVNTIINYIINEFFIIFS